MDTYTCPDTGDQYISCDLLTVGDYGGAGSVGEANIRTCEEQYPDCWVRYGTYGFRQAWLLDTEDNRDLIRDLERDYHVLDDCILSRVENEWEHEAFDNHVKKDLLDCLPDHLRDLADTWGDEDLYRLYHDAQAETQIFPSWEYSGCYIPVNKLADSFVDQCHQDAWKQLKAIDREGIRLLPRNPEDLEPDTLLVAADWFMEHGHDTLAAYLRGQAESFADA